MSFNVYQKSALVQHAEMARRCTHSVELGLELLMLRSLNEHMLIVDVLDNVQVLVIVVDLYDDCFDRGITLDEYAC